MPQKEAKLSELNKAIKSMKGLSYEDGGFEACYDLPEVSGTLTQSAISSMDDQELESLAVTLSKAINDRMTKGESFQEPVDVLNWVTTERKSRK